MSTVYTDAGAVDQQHGEGTAKRLILLATVAQVEKVRAKHGSGHWTRRYREGVAAAALSDPTGGAP